MSNYNWCHGTSCHEKHTVDRVRGVKGSKVLRTRKVPINRWNENTVWRFFCSQGCLMDFITHHCAEFIEERYPRTEPKETPIEVEIETRTDWRGQPYKQKVIKEIDNQDQSAVG